MMATLVFVDILFKINAPTTMNQIIVIQRGMDDMILSVGMDRMRIIWSMYYIEPLGRYI